MKRPLAKASKGLISPQVLHRQVPEEGAVEVSGVAESEFGGRSVILLLFQEHVMLMCIFSKLCTGNPHLVLRNVQILCEFSWIFLDMTVNLTSCCNCQDCKDCKACSHYRMVYLNVHVTSRNSYVMSSNCANY